MAIGDLVRFAIFGGAVLLDLRGLDSCESSDSFLRSVIWGIVAAASAFLALATTVMRLRAMRS